MFYLYGKTMENRGKQRKIKGKGKNMSFALVVDKLHTMFINSVPLSSLYHIAIYILDDFQIFPENICSVVKYAVDELYKYLRFVQFVQ